MNSLKEKEHVSQTILHALVKVDSITIVTVWLNPVKLSYTMFLHVATKVVPKEQTNAKLDFML